MTPKIILHCLYIKNQRMQPLLYNKVYCHTRKYSWTFSFIWIFSKSSISNLKIITRIEWSRFYSYLSAIQNYSSILVVLSSNFHLLTYGIWRFGAAKFTPSLQLQFVHIMTQGLSASSSKNGFDARIVCSVLNTRFKIWIDDII